MLFNLMQLIDCSTVPGHLVNIIKAIFTSKFVTNRVSTNFPTPEILERSPLISHSLTFQLFGDNLFATEVNRKSEIGDMILRLDIATT